MPPIKERMNFQCMIVAVRSATEEVARKAWKIIFESWIFQACLETTARITEIVSIRRLNTWLSCIHIIYMLELPISQLHKPWHISKTSWFNSISVHQLSKSSFQSRKKKKQKRKAMIHRSSNIQTLQHFISQNDSFRFQAVISLISSFVHRVLRFSWSVG